MVNTRRDYSAELVQAARTVLVEVMHVLGEYRGEIVLVGGWVPELLLPQARQRHVGSIDIDLALDHRRFPPSGYRKLKELLESRGYREGGQPYIFFRTVTMAGRDIEVEVDFLAGEYEGTGKGHRTQPVQDMRARKARGCELAFELSKEITVTGALPGGGQDSVRVRIASVVPFLVMKANALADRVKEKDAWDIYYCLRNFPGGVRAIAEEFLPHRSNGLVREAMAKLREKFASPDHVGPKFVADFEEITDAEARASLQRDAFEQVNYLVNQVQGDQGQ
jgi:hypothetical protein